MSSPPLTNRSWTIITVSLLTWVVLLSFGLSVFYGARFSGGWLIAGGMISIAAFCGLLVLKEILDAILSSRLYLWCHSKMVRTPGHPTAPPSRTELWENAGNLLDSSFSGSRRAILGLCSGEFSINRRRKPVKYSASSPTRLAGNPAY